MDIHHHTQHECDVLNDMPVDVLKSDAYLWSNVTCFLCYKCPYFHNAFLHAIWMVNYSYAKECHGICIHQQIDVFFESVFRLTPKKISKRVGLTKAQLCGKCFYITSLCMQKSSCIIVMHYALLPLTALDFPLSTQAPRCQFQIRTHSGIAIC